MPRPEWTPWDQLGAGQRTRVSFVLAALEKLAFGLFMLNEIAQRDSEDRTPLRFYVSSVYQYFSNLFLVRDGNLRTLLVEIGCTDIVQPVDEALATQFGDLTLAVIIRRWRNKMIVHPTFDFEEVNDNVYGHFDLEKPENLAIYATAFQTLSVATARFLAQLTERYPEAPRP